MKGTFKQPALLVLRLAIAASALLAIPASFAGDLTALAATERSADITIELNGITGRDQDVFIDAGGTSLADLGALHHSLDTTAFHRADNGDRLVAFDVTAVLPGGLLYRPGDVVRYDGAMYTQEFDASVLGIPPGVQTDAISFFRNGDLMLSFDTTVRVDDLIIPDEDAVRFDGAHFLQLFDASDAGIDPVLDLDAMHYDPVSETLIMSFDGHGDLTMFQFADEDLLAFDFNDMTWSLVVDASADDVSWILADLDAAYLAFVLDVLLMDGFE